MEEYLRESMPPQIPSQWLLVLDEPRRSVGGRKRGREVEVKPRIDSMFPRRGGGPLGIRHEDHSTHRGDGTMTNALKSSLGSFAVPSPIVGIDDEKTGLTSVT